ncbi:hypothetical protein ACQP2X_06165 [Actinoplanes sp. CA-131856]
MSPARVGASTEDLNSPALRHAAQEIKQAIEAYEAGVSGVGQVVLHQRNSDLDEYVVQLVTQSPEITKSLLAMIERAAHGDVGATKEMADFFAKAEEDNVTESTNGPSTTHH